MSIQVYFRGSLSPKEEQRTQGTVVPTTAQGWLDTSYWRSLEVEGKQSLVEEVYILGTHLLERTSFDLEVIKSDKLTYHLTEKGFYVHPREAKVLEEGGLTKVIPSAYYRKNSEGTIEYQGTVALKKASFDLKEELEGTYRSFEAVEGLVQIFEASTYQTYSRKTAEQKPLKFRVFMQHLPGKDLCSLLNSNQLGSYEDQQKLMVRLLQNTMNLHRKGLAHRDIKPNNICFEREGDFRSATFIDPDFVTKTSSMGSCRLRGTPMYTPPEWHHTHTKNLNQFPPTFTPREGELTAGDCWSLGITFLKVHAGNEEKPLNELLQTIHEMVRISDMSNNTLLPKVMEEVNGKVLTYLDSQTASLEDVYPQLKTVLTGLLEANYEKRMGAQEALTLLQEPTRSFSLEELEIEEVYSEEEVLSSDDGI